MRRMTDFNGINIIDEEAELHLKEAMEILKDMLIELTI